MLTHCKYTANARTFGPPHVGAVASTGNDPVASCPQPQHTRHATCPATCTVISGTSKHMTRRAANQFAACRLPPHPPRVSGRWVRVSSGSLRRCRRGPAAPVAYPPYGPRHDVRPRHLSFLAHFVSVTRWRPRRIRRVLPQHCDLCLQIGQPLLQQYIRFPQPQNQRSLIYYQPLKIRSADTIHPTIKPTTRGEWWTRVNSCGILEQGLY